MFRIIVFIIIVFLLLVAYVRYIESHAIFFPMKEMELNPRYIGLAFEDVYLNSEDNIRLNGWFIPAENARRTILFLHGNAGNLSHRLEKITILNKLGVNIFIIDYRGYGRSQGKPDEAGIYLDARAAYDYLLKERKVAPEQIILYGESLGNAVVIDLAAEKKVGGVIIESGFSRGRDVVKSVYWFVPNFFFSNAFDSLSKIKKVSGPKLFIHSRNDEIVPLRLAQKLYAAADGPKEFVEIIGSHNTAYMDSKDEYTSGLASFIAKFK
jgi:fermentation-respiration switch protein FrsA (DUF1100 family)